MTPRQRRKLRYILAKADGKCTVCKKRDAMGGQTQCGYCADLRDELRRQLQDRRRGEGKCIQCETPTGGPWRCRKHADQFNAVRRRRMAAKRAAKRLEAAA